MSDYISREDAIKGYLNLLKMPGEVFVTEVTDLLQTLPAADVRENKKRYWYEDEAGCAICSECREYAFETSTHHISGWFPRFCPNCGADMREEQI